MREIKFRAWDKESQRMQWPCEISIGGLQGSPIHRTFEDGYIETCPPNPGVIEDYVLMQFTGLLDKNNKEIYEGDIIGREGVYHFVERDGWQPSAGSWKLIGEKSKDFTGNGEEKYIAGYELALVSWQDSSCGFEPFSDSAENCGHCGGSKRPSDWEVIGNVYENPELLNKNL